MIYYFRKQQTRRYDQDWEERLYNTLKEIDPDLECEEFPTKKRIKQLGKMGIKLKVYKRLTTKQALKKKEEELEKILAKKTKHMSPIQAFMYRDKFMKEQKEEKDQPDLENEIANKLLKEYLKEEKEEIDQTQSLVWEEFKKEGKRTSVHGMKKKVHKWLGREKSDIRGKIEKKRIEITQNLEKHRQLLKEIERIKQRNERDARFMPMLEEAKEKNRIMMMINYKDHINKVLGNRIMNHWRKCMKENASGKRRMKMLIREANMQRKEIFAEQQEFQEVFGLYGQEAYLQNGEDPIRAMDIIFEI
jgi:hypothetical protein